MDCRYTLHVAALCLACVAGCETLAPWQSDDKKKDKTADAKDGKDTKPSQEVWIQQTKLKPETLCAYAKFKESAAQDPAALEVDREHYREQARTSYMRALEEDPKCHEAHLGLARLFDTMGNHDRAVACYQGALKVRPKDIDTWMELGMSHARNKEWEPALTSMKQAVKLDPDARQNVKTLGFTLARSGRYEEAFDTLRRVVGAAEAHFCIAQMLYQMEQDGAARQHIELALHDNPQMKEAQVLLDKLENENPGARNEAQPRQGE
jgi:tetratricopeptide (TPR) repeat protein